jgi:predicted membrane channel-forming protein YqfA (hemolysin III family)
MVLRSDHVAGAAFVAFGFLVIGLSGDLPTGGLSMPGSGFLPKIVATLTIVFGLTLIVRASAESPPFAGISWSDGAHAAMVTVIAALAVLLYTRLGFLITMAAMMIALLVVIERRKPLYAVAYSLSVVLFVYGVFHYVLKAPLPAGPFAY